MAEHLLAVRSTPRTLIERETFLRFMTEILVTTLTDKECAVLYVLLY